MIAVFLGGGSNFKPGVAVGNDTLARIFMYAYGILVTVTWTNLFIAALVDIFDEASKMVQKERESHDFDPIDFIMDNLYKLQQTISNIQFRKKKNRIMENETTNV